MTRRLAKYLALATVLLPALLPALAGTDWLVNQPHTSVTFTIRHLLTNVTGRFNDFKGAIHYDPANPGASTVDFTVQATSIDTANADRDKHLRSADFFNVEKFPTLTFKSKKVTAKGKEALEVTGDFTLLGVTKEITVPVKVLGLAKGPWGDVAGFEGQFKIDRKAFGMQWNKALDQGGFVLGDEVTIQIAIEANPVPEKAK